MEKKEYSNSKLPAFCTLTRRWMMLPVKACSGIMGIVPADTTDLPKPCDYCEYGSTCPASKKGCAALWLTGSPNRIHIFFPPKKAKKERSVSEGTFLSFCQKKVKGRDARRRPCLLLLGTF